MRDKTLRTSAWEATAQATFSVTNGRSEFPVAPAKGNSDWPVDNAPFLLLVRLCFDYKHDMAFAVDFDHLSFQVGNTEPKQEQKLAVEALLSGKYVMAVLPTGFDKTIIYERRGNF